MYRIVFALCLAACIETDPSLDEVESDATVPTTITTLTKFTPVTISGASGSTRYFKIEVPAGYDDVTAARTPYPTYIGADVYMKRGALPSTSSYDCRTLNGGQGPCRVDYPEGGTYYILVRGAGTNGYSNMSLTADYRNRFSPIPNHYSEYIYNQYGYDRQYKLAVPANQSSVSFTFTLDPTDDGAVDMYVSYPTFATATSYDCYREIDWNHFTSTGTCTFTNPPAGTYYVALLGRNTKYVGTFSASYRWQLTNTGTTTAAGN